MDLLDLPQITAVITLSNGTSFLADFEQWSVRVCTTRTAMSTDADLTIARKKESVSVVVKSVK